MNLPKTFDNPLHAVQTIIAMYRSNPGIKIMIDFDEEDQDDIVRSRTKYHITGVTDEGVHVREGIVANNQFLEIRENGCVFDTFGYDKVVKITITSVKAREPQFQVGDNVIIVSTGKTGHIRGFRSVKWKRDDVDVLQNLGAYIDTDEITANVHAYPLWDIVKVIE